MKKNLLLLFACMVFAATSFAQTGGVCGENLTWTLDETTGTLTISGEGEMKDFGVGLAPWHKNRASITNLNIESGVTSIGWGAFAQCSEIVSVNLPEGLTTIGEDSFYECLKLSSVNIPNTVTSIGGLAFAYCLELTSITIPEGVTTIGSQTFLRCDKLEVINFNAINCTTTWPSYFQDEGQRRVFAECFEVSTLNIGNQVTNIPDYAFGNLSDLDVIVIPNSVTSIGAYAFFQCFPESVTFGTGVQVIGEYAFINCSSIKSIELPAGLTTIGRDAFANCDGMTSLTIPNSVTSIGAYAFSNCVKLESVTVQWVTPLSIDEVLRFSGVNTRFVRLNVPEGTEEDYFGATAWKDFYIEGLSPHPGGECGINLTWTYDMDGTLTVTGYGPMPDWYYNYGATNPWNFLSGNIHTVILPEGLTYIGDYAFSNFSELTSLTIPAGVSSIGDRVFDNYSPKLRTITCLNPTPPSVYTRTFNGLSNVANIKLNVPAGTADAYRAAPVWQDFMIEESTGIETSTTDDAVVATRYYDLQGKEVTSPQQGQIYIAKELHRSGKTTARKIPVND